MRFLKENMIFSTDQNETRGPFCKRRGSFFARGPYVEKTHAAHYNCTVVVVGKLFTIQPNSSDSRG